MTQLGTLSALSIIAAAVGCTVQPTTAESADGGSDTEANVDAGTASTTHGATIKKNALNFAPSNVPKIIADETNDIQVTGNCSFDTDAGTTDCSYEGFRYETITQNDADQTEVGVFVTGSLSIGSDAVVSVTGSRPIVIVTSGTFLIKGIIQATPKTYAMYDSNGGGFSSPIATSAGHEGKGPGGGGAPTGTNGGGGGAYCGKGGGTNGGTPYGNAEISPLLGGSSGALGGSWAGAGGGAIQLVSASSITLTSLAKINVGGGGGEWEGNGGGSGGAILLEAPVVTMGGTLAANGGGGGGNAIDLDASGSCGTPDTISALGGVTTADNPGGNGSAGTIIDGSDGNYTGYVDPLGNYSGGGGGGAGRIRINTTTGQAGITGTLSPTASTTCVSQGKLKTT